MRLLHEAVLHGAAQLHEQPVVEAVHVQDAYGLVMEAQLGQQGLNLDMYCSFMNTTKEALREESRAAAEANLKNQAAIDKIVMLEGIEPSEQEIGEAIALICRQNGITRQQLEAHRDDAFNQAIIKNVLTTKVMSLIRANAQITVE